jgi:hypothetical protein
MIIAGIVFLVIGTMMIFNNNRADRFLGFGLAVVGLALCMAATL